MRNNNRPTDNNGLEENRGHRGGRAQEVPAPSPAEIAAACEEIRKSWPAWRLRLRAGFSRWRVQSVHCRQLGRMLEHS